MRALTLFYRLTLFYIAFAILMFGVLRFVPGSINYLPVGGAQSLLAETGNDPFANIEVGATEVSDMRGSVTWVLTAIFGALLISLPVSWTYIASRKEKFYNGSIVRAVIILPMILTSIVLMVHNSLALAFSLAGIVGAIRFRNTLKDPGDALYILIAIGIGLAGGIGALEIAFAMTMAVNYVSTILWITEFGVKDTGNRYMRRPYRSGEKDLTVVEAILNTNTDETSGEDEAEIADKEKSAKDTPKKSTPKKG